MILRRKRIENLRKMYTTTVVMYFKNQPIFLSRKDLSPVQSRETHRLLRAVPEDVSSRNRKNVYEVIHSTMGILLSDRYRRSSILPKKTRRQKNHHVLYNAHNRLITNLDLSMSRYSTWTTRV